MSDPRGPVVIACMPADPTRLPAELDHLAVSVVSVDHRQITCARCSGQCWIGREQLRTLRDPGATALCYLCIIADPDLLRLASTSPVIALNPRADQVPRRSSSWLVRPDGTP